MANRTVSVKLMADIGSYVGGMNTAAAATARLGDSATSSTAKAKSGFDLAGKGALIMGGTIVAGMAMAVSKSMEFEKSMSAVGAATKATTGTLLDLREAAMRAGADTQYSATEAANAITEMAKAGVSAEDIMGGGLKGALSLAAAGQLEVADAAGIASVAMTQFNLSGEDLPHVADLLAAGAGKAMGSVDDLGQALNQAGLVASSTGLSIEETTGTLAAFASAGLMGSDAGTSLKTALQRLQNPSEEAAGVMAELGVNMYDSNGAFIGMAALAGQLETGMASLTQAERDKAMATIFGSDAVRAANVLYKEGAAGIADWTNKVNDQGYAADQAARLTDNLAGDLERLGGSFDTLLITLGEGAQGPLRTLVQALGGLVDGITWLVEAWDSLPGPVQAGMAALVAFRLLSGPVTTAISALGAAAAAAGGPLGLLKSGAGGLLSALGGPVGLAIAGTTVALGYMVSGLMNVGKATVDTVGYQEALTVALKESNGAITENVRALAAKQAAETEVGKGSLIDYAKRAGVELSVLTDALLGQPAAIRSVNTAFDEYTQAAGLMGQATGVDADRLAMLSQEGDVAKDAIGQLVPVLGEAQTKNQDLAAATAETTTATHSATSGAEQFAAATEAAKESVDAAKQSVDAFKLALDILTGAHVSMIQVESAFESAIDSADGALENMNGTVLDGAGDLNLQSDAGRKAADVLLGVRDSGNQLIATMKQQGATQDEVRAKDAQLRTSFIQTANQMGITGGNADRLADQILGIPGSRNTVISADTRPAQTAIDGLVNSNSGRVIALAVTAPGRGATVTGRMGGVSLAAGGPVYGPGTATSDSIPAMLSNGEFVINAKATSYNRELLEAINSGRVGQFASGGLVTKVTADTSGAQRSIDAFAASLAQSMAASSGPAGSGAMGGGWTSIFNFVKSRIPAARVNSAYRPGDPGYHGRGKAVDFGYGTGPGGAGSAGLASINRLLHDSVGGSLAELIYTGSGDDRPDLKNGRPLNYGAATNAAHRNHVHAAVYDQGGPLYPGYTLAYNGTGKTEYVSREFPGGGGRGGTSGGPANVTVQAQIFVGSQEITDIARVEATAIVVGALGGVTDRGRYNS